METESLNVLMIKYEENVNVVAKINAELCKRHGLEHYLTEFSSNLIRALNQYKRFVMLFDERTEFINSIVKFSESCIAFFETHPDVNSKVIKIRRKALKREYYNNIEKMNVLVRDMNRINDIINTTFAESVAKYLED